MNLTGCDFTEKDGVHTFRQTILAPQPWFLNKVNNLVFTSKHLGNFQLHTRLNLYKSCTKINILEGIVYLTSGTLIITLPQTLILNPYLQASRAEPRIIKNNISSTSADTNQRQSHVWMSRKWHAWLKQTINLRRILNEYFNSKRLIPTSVGNLMVQ